MVVEQVMPQVVVERSMRNVAVDRVWSIARRLTDYPMFMDQVVSVEPCAMPHVINATSWIVLLNGNELRWIEQDEYDDANRRMTFQQIEGDLAEWAGSFETAVVDGQVLARYDVTFDLGVPALADVLHPLGEIAIRSNCRQMLEELERQSRLVPQANE
ncbi:SRPBCC family protein [Phenylobacterium sp.]|uniref:SRPBCC family protein n=1 Tax=Phenylobacterium sp. TaxID=1871053 RepID=UPI003BAB69B4